MNSQDHDNNKNGMSNYTKFFLMLGSSFIAMYITMYLNTYEFDHVWFSLTRFYMVCLGIAAMALIDIQDPEVKKLAEDIIKAQRKEIEEMKAMIKRLENEK